VWHYSIQAGREKELQKLLLLIRKTYQFGDARLAGIGWIAGAVRYDAAGPSSFLSKTNAKLLSRHRDIQHCKPAVARGINRVD
jgi:hypothetical protein